MVSTSVPAVNCQDLGQAVREADAVVIVPSDSRFSFKVSAWIEAHKGTFVSSSLGSTNFQLMQETGPGNGPGPGPGPGPPPPPVALKINCTIAQEVRMMMKPMTADKRIFLAKAILWGMPPEVIQT